ncbi:hypothetical protein NM897_09695 [Planococcus maritimus]|uniref:hypothetical protein n=1 Tax=Planococcus maritimus TaxID=192421 RepID=UPI003139F16D
MNIAETLQRLEALVPSENFRKQPDTARKELLDFETEYAINTSDFLGNIGNISRIPADIQEIWLETLDTFLLFDGSIEELNHLKVAFAEDTLEEEFFPYKNQSLRKEYIQKQATPYSGFVACFFCIILLIFNPSLG